MEVSGFKLGKIMLAEKYLGQKVFVCNAVEAKVNEAVISKITSGFTTGATLSCLCYKSPCLFRRLIRELGEREKGREGQ